MSRWCVKHDLAAGYTPRVRGERELPASAAGEEPVGDEGDQRHEHDRPEQSGEQQRKENPDHSERSEASTKASSAKTHPTNYQQELVWQGAHEHQDGVQNPFEVPCRDRLDVGHKTRAPFDALVLWRYTKPRSA